MTSIRWENLSTSDLIVDATYESKRQIPHNLSCEPMAKLLPGIGNMGGFRRSVNYSSKNTIVLVLMSTGKETAWPDEIDVYQGIYTYYGDNRAPGSELHDTPKKGNLQLKNIFELAHGTKEDRGNCPIILIFQNRGVSHDLIFKGIAVPGAKNLTLGEDLIAVWASKENQRFQNYKATFTILDASNISGGWIREVLKSKKLDYADSRAPIALKRWVEFGDYQPLVANPIEMVRTSAEQRPLPGTQTELIETIIDYCREDPWLFEAVAARVWQMSVAGEMQIDLTRKWKDGGRDAVGHLLIGPTSDPLKIHFALEAKCLSFPSGVGVKYMSRLISRLKHREFGVMVTTSSVNSQAYEEIREDGHPIVIVSGRDIAQILIKGGIDNSQTLRKWIEAVPVTRLS